MSLPLFDEKTLREVADWQHEEIKKLREGIQKFVDKNFVGGSKAEREDYSQMVSCKDIYDLRELLLNGGK